MVPNPGSGDDDLGSESGEKGEVLGVFFVEGEKEFCYVGEVGGKRDREEVETSREDLAGRFEIEGSVGEAGKEEGVAGTDLRGMDNVEVDDLAEVGPFGGGEARFKANTHCTDRRRRGQFVLPWDRGFD